MSKDARLTNLKFDDGNTAESPTNADSWPVACGASRVGDPQAPVAVGVLTSDELVLPELAPASASSSGWSSLRFRAGAALPSCSLKNHWKGKGTAMAYVITAPCLGYKDTACVDACPVDCIHPKKDEPAFEGARQLYINPVECIDCGACLSVCPVQAIFAEDEVPQQWKRFIELNARHFNS